MKKLLLSAVALLGFGLAAEAQTLSVADNEFVALKGESNTLTVNVGEATQVRDVQFDITVPAGVTIGTPVAAVNTYSVAISDATDVNGNNKYTVILYSASAATGASAIEFPLTIDNGVTPWATVSSSTSDGKVTNVSAVESAATSTPYTFEIGLLADVNKVNGVTADDAQAILNYSVGTIPATFVKGVANVNRDSANAITADDAQAALNISVGGSSVKAEVDFDKVVVDDDDIIWAD